jgi:hypothetical protein
VLSLAPHATRLLLLALLFVAGCTKSSQPPPGGGGAPGGGGPGVGYEPLTGVWQGPVDAGSRAAILRFTLVEDAGKLVGFQAVNDPEQPAEFHTIDRLNGVRRGNEVVLHGTNETITATLDGGRLIGSGSPVSAQAPPIPRRSR